MNHLSCVKKNKSFYNISKNTLLGLMCVGALTTHAHAMWDPSDPHRFAGDILQLAIPISGGLVAVSQDDTEGLKQLGMTVASTAVITQGMKYGFDGTPLGRRPDGNRLSFPSGHTSNACAGAAFIGQRYGWKYGTPAMATAGYVGWTRVQAKRHHVRDVVVGCALGVGAGLLLTTPQGEQIVPWYENETFGIQISSKW